jgi:hypothetical protein
MTVTATSGSSISASLAKIRQQFQIQKVANNTDISN